MIRLDTMIKILKKQQTGSGPYAQAGWETLTTVKCEWKDINSIEALKAGTTQALGFAQIRLRRVVGLDASCHVLRGSEEWEIIGNPQKEGTFYKIKLQRAVAG